MRIKTFTGTDREAVDKQINDWVAESKVTVHQTDVALKPLRERGWDAVAGKLVQRRALAVAITVWYEPSEPQPRPDTWVFKCRGRKNSN